jgi:cytochrome c oxidase subunit 3
MSTHVTIETEGKVWDGRRLALGATYGKVMMWFFLLSDALTFSAFLTAYGFFRFASTTWPSPEIVFQSFPFLAPHGGWPLVFVGLMTFILIASSLTMVLAVEAGHRKDNRAVLNYLIATIIGGATFLGCQAYEWSHLLHQGLWIGVSNNDFQVDNEIHNGIHHASLDGTYDHSAKEWVAERRIFYPVKTVIDGVEWNIGGQATDQAARLLGPDHFPVSDKPVLDYNGVAYMNAHGDYINPGNAQMVIPSGETMMFGKLFFFITGFHGFHVFSGVLILLIVCIMAAKGIMAKRGHYEMVEKVGLYWHFVDLVWVFVFTLFYLI